MLYPARLIARYRVPLGPALESAPAPARFLEIAHVLTALFDQEPAVLYLPGGATLTLLYRNADYFWQDITDNVAPLAASIPREMGLCFFGATKARETVELSLVTEGGEGVVSLRSVSGARFGQLQGLGLQAQFPAAATAAALAELAAADSLAAGCGVVSKRHEELLSSCGLLAPTPGSLFAYFAWEPPTPRQFLCALTAAHKARLWRTFLLDGQQPREFEWLWENYYTGEALFLLEWELALRLVLEELSFQVRRDSASFCLLDGQGRERRFDFSHGGPAEKLFLKLLFPVDTK